MVLEPNFNSWVRCLNPNSHASLRLFCFPYAGGGAAIFRAWSNHLPSYVEVCPIQLPGREDRWKEAPFTHISPLVEKLTQVLYPYLDIPFAFFGHSMGALISFELARQLRVEEDLSPVHLFVSGRRAPQVPDNNSLHTLSDLKLLEELRQLNGTPEKVLKSPELMQLLLPTLRADFSVCETYSYLKDSPLDCAISAFGGIEDPRESRDLIESWSRQTQSQFSLQMLPGDHFFLGSSQPLLLKLLAAQLNQIVSDCLCEG